MSKKLAVLIITILMSIFLAILCYFAIKIELNKSSSKKCIDDMNEFTKLNSETVFSINKITYFSSANGEVTINQNSSFTVSNLYQYTDIALFINNNSDGNFNAKNTLKSVNLSDIKYELSPSIGNSNLYYKNINDFTKNIFEEKNILNDSLDFTISSEDEIDYSLPTLFNNCANPITLCYVNSNIKPNYTLPSGTSNISYDR